MRKTLTRALYLLFVDLVCYALVVHPVYAFQVSSSTTGYARVASQAAVSAYQGARAVAQAEAIAAAVVGSASGASVALRLVAGASWPALGVLAGVTLLQIYLDSQKTDALKAAAAPPAEVSTPGFTAPAGSELIACSTPCYGNNNQILIIPFNEQLRQTTGSGCSFDPTPGTGWSGPWTIPNHPGCGWLHQGSETSTVAIQAAGGPATAPQIADYLKANPSTMTDNLTVVGVAGQPQSADTVATVPVTPTELPTSVVPASQVAPTDAVIDPSAPKPNQTTSTQTTTQHTTTTTTTTTNPDGSTTKAEEATAVQSCTSGNHEQRTAGSILQDHMKVWGGSGLVGALNLLKTLTWPSTPPTYMLTSATWGTYTLDFAPWTGMLTAIRSIIIALAGFVAYRIIFVGSK